MNTQRGKIIEMGQVQEGQTKAGGVWQRQTIVIEWGVEFVHDLALQVGTKNIAEVNRYKVGDVVDVDYFVNSRPWNDKWFTNADLYAIRSASLTADPTRERPKSEPIGQGFDTEPKDDDLPFDL